MACGASILKSLLEKPYTGLICANQANVEFRGGMKAPEKSKLRSGYIVPVSNSVTSVVDRHHAWPVKPGVLVPEDQAPWRIERWVDLSTRWPNEARCLRAAGPSAWAPSVERAAAESTVDWRSRNPRPRDGNSGRHLVNQPADVEDEVLEDWCSHDVMTCWRRAACVAPVLGARGCSLNVAEDSDVRTRICRLHHLNKQEIWANAHRTRDASWLLISNNFDQNAFLTNCMQADE